MPGKFKFDSPETALHALAAKLHTVDSADASADPTGQALFEDLVADRDSPAADVSAMDGYAVELDALNQAGEIQVVGESAPGAAPPSLQTGTAVRIFTGAIVPAEADLVIKREDTDESETAIVLSNAAKQLGTGENIRRAGENARQGAIVLSRGTQVTAAVRATMANFGVYQAKTFRPVRVSIITSGNEVGLFEDASPEAWQLRNSNRFAIESLLAKPWINLVGAHHCRDDQQSLHETVQKCISESDAVLLTGGVSMGDYDYVPDVVAGAGGEIVFHGLPIRPGKPILGAATGDGKLIIGLPGNPVSATVCCHRFALPLLAKMNGQTDWNPSQTKIPFAGAGDKTIPLHWMRLAKLTPDGAVAIQSQGSGDLVSLGQSTGYVEVAPSESGPGPWPYRAWQ